MHDIGRTVKEMYEADHEHGFNTEYEMTNEAYGLQPEFSDEWSQEYAQEADQESALYGEIASPFNEMQEMELASELLEIQTEEELDQFLGKLIKRVAPQGVRNFFNSKAGSMLGGVLKQVAKRALPLAGRVVGGMFGGPIGAKIGGGVGRFASRAFGLELEGLSPEDQEFALSRAFVRFAGSAARNVQSDSKSRVQPSQAVRAGVVKAAHRFAPGLLVPMPGRYQANRHKGVYNHKDYEDNRGYTSQEF